MTATEKETQVDSYILTEMQKTADTDKETDVHVVVGLPRQTADYDENFQDIYRPFKINYVVYVPPLGTGQSHS